MTRGILDTLGLAVVVAFAAPVGLAGVFFLTDGQVVLGVGFLGIAALMILLQDRLTTPMDVPGAIVQRVVGTVVPDERTDEEDETTGK